MTFSKLLPVFCAAAVGAAGFAARAGDNSAQAAARIALAKQLFDMNAQSASNAPAADSNVVMHPVDTADARVEPQPAPAAPAKATAQAAPSESNADAAKRADAEKAALSAAVTAPTNGAARTPAVSATNAPVPVAAADLNYPGKDLGLKPVVAPPLPISATKQQRLQALLDKYKADQLTPEEYHEQRAAILAEP